jgi:hypothetical protein
MAVEVRITKAWYLLIHGLPIVDDKNKNKKKPQKEEERVRFLKTLDERLDWIHQRIHETPTKPKTNQTVLYKPTTKEASVWIPQPLANLVNTCFANSALQALLSFDTLRLYFSTNQHEYLSCPIRKHMPCGHCRMQMLLDNYDASTQPAKNRALETLTSNLDGWIMASMKPGTQQASDEYYTFLLGRLDNEEKLFAPGAVGIAQMLYSRSYSVKRCLLCGHRIEIDRETAMFTMTMPWGTMDPTATLEECLQSYTSRGQANSALCDSPGCFNYVSEETRMGTILTDKSGKPQKDSNGKVVYKNKWGTSIRDKKKNIVFPDARIAWEKDHTTYPEVYYTVEPGEVIVFLNPTFLTSRDSKVVFPVHVDLARYSYAYKRSEEEGAKPEKEEGFTAPYELVAVVAHDGWIQRDEGTGVFTESGGHYVAYVKPNRDRKEWYYCSDSTVRKCDIETVLEQRIYFAFYRHQPKTKK